MEGWGWGWGEKFLGKLVKRKRRGGHARASPLNVFVSWVVYMV